MSHPGQSYKIRTGVKYKVSKKAMLEDSLRYNVHDLQDGDTIQFENNCRRLELEITAKADGKSPTSSRTFIPGHVAALPLGELGLIEIEAPAIKRAPDLGGAIKSASVGPSELQTPPRQIDPIRTGTAIGAMIDNESARRTREALTDEATQPSKPANKIQQLVQAPIP